MQDNYFQNTLNRIVSSILKRDLPTNHCLIVEENVQPEETFLKYESVDIDAEVDFKIAEVLMNV